MSNNVNTPVKKTVKKPASGNGKTFIASALGNAACSKYIRCDLRHSYPPFSSSER